jgi:hypothetical protein
MKDRIIELLGKGISAVQVASAVGCDDSYISQLLSEPGVSEQVQALKATHFAKYAEQDASLDDAEARALQRVSQLLDFATRPAEAVRIFGILNAAKRRTSDTLQNAQPVAQTVQLDLPAAARVRFTLTTDRQVIEVEGRSMTTMPAKSLAAQLEQRNAARLLATDVPSMLLPSKKDIPLAERL